MERDAAHKKVEKQVLTIDEIELINKDLQAKYEELLKSSSLLEAEKKKWITGFKEFDDFYNNAPCGYHTFDENGLILQMNQTELDWLGYTREEVIGKKNSQDILSPDSLMLFYRYVPMLREKGYMDQVEATYKRKDGSLYSRLVSGRSFYDAAGNYKGVRITLWDITDRKKMEEEMLKVNRQFLVLRTALDEKSKALETARVELQGLREQKRALDRIMAKDMQQSIDNVQHLSLNMLADVHLQEADRQQQLHDIYKEANKLSRFITDYRVKQRLSEDTGLQWARINLSRLLVNIMSRFENEAAAKDLNMNYEVFEDYWLVTDEEYFSEIMDQLASRTISSAPEGCEILAKLLRETDRYLLELDMQPSARKEEDVPMPLSKKQVANRVTDNGPSVPAWDLTIVNDLVSKLGYTLRVNAEGNMLSTRLMIPLKDV